MKNNSEKVAWTGVIISVEPRTSVWRYKIDNHEAGYFGKNERNPKSRKIWWFSRGSSYDPARMKKHYDIWWCVVPEFDGDI